MERGGVAFRAARAVHGIGRVTVVSGISCVFRVGPRENR